MHKVKQVKLKPALDAFCAIQSGNGPGNVTLTKTTSHLFTNSLTSSQAAYIHGRPMWRQHGCCQSVAFQVEWWLRQQTVDTVLCQQQGTQHTVISYTTAIVSPSLHEPFSSYCCNLAPLNINGQMSSPSRGSNATDQ